MGHASEESGGGGQVSHDEPDPALIERLRRILRDVQGVWPDGLDSPLPNLADRSITILNLMVAIDDDLRVEVPLDVFFDVKTLRDLVEAVAAQPSYRQARL